MSLPFDVRPRSRVLRPPHGRRNLLSVVSSGRSSLFPAHEIAVVSNSIACPGCNTRYNAAPRLAGRTLTCPKCGQSICVPPATVPPLQLAQHEQTADEQDANVHVPQTRGGTASDRGTTREEGRVAFNFWIPMIGFTGIGLLTGLAAGSLIVALLRPPKGSVAAEPVAHPAVPAVVDAGGPARPPTAETLSASPEVSPNGAAVPNTPTGDAEADSASSATAWQVVELRELGSSFAFDGESGALAAVNTESSKLYLYSDEFFQGDAKRIIGPVATGNRPSRVRFKNHNGRQLLIVAHRDEAALRLFDAETLSPVRQIDLPVSDVVQMVGFGSIGQFRMAFRAHYTGRTDGDSGSQH